MLGSKRIVIVMCLVLLGATSAFAFNPEELDMKVDATLAAFDEIVTNSEELTAAAQGALVCPKISKVGLGLAGEGGYCALLIDGKTAEYWRASAVTVGLTVGVQSSSQVMAFMTSDALDKFRKSNLGFEVGVTGSVAVMKHGASGKVNTNDIKGPVAVWIFGEKGLMADLSLDGSTYKRIGVVGEDVRGEPLHRFVATAQLRNRSNDPTARMTIDIEAWVTDAERAAYQKILKEEGFAGFQKALAEAPDFGTVKQPGGTMMIEYAYYTEMPDGTYRVILGSTQPMAFLNPKAQASRLEENVTVIQLDLNKDRLGTGVIQMGAEIGWDDGVTIKSDYRTDPVKLESVSYKKFN